VEPGNSRGELFFTAATGVRLRLAMHRVLVNDNISGTFAGQ